MESISLLALVAEHLQLAHQSGRGRSSHTIVGGHEHALRQTLIALVAEQVLADHESPGEATLQVLHGSVRLVTQTEAMDIVAGDIAAIPAGRHRLEAIQDAVALLTVAIRQ